MSRRLVASAAIAVVVASGAEARADFPYCRTTTCDANVQDCSPNKATGCVENGQPLYWAGACVGYSLQQNASRRVSLADATHVVDAAFATWQQVQCPSDGRHPGIVIVDLGPVACDKHEYNQTSGNANAIVFRDTKWPYAGPNNTLALTTVTYNVETGEIYDADMEINGTVELTIGEPVHYDLQSIVTHEAGHFLGFAHSLDPKATMFARYDEGTVDLRNLSPVDIAGVCTVYPPPANPQCDPTPRHGFSGECATEATAGSKGCCTTAPGKPRNGGSAALSAALGALAVATARRRRRGA